MYTYSPAEVSILVGSLIIKNWETVAVELDEDEWTFEEGADGEISRTKKAGKMGSVTLTLKQHSSSNTDLTALSVTDAVATINVIDGSGDSLHMMPEGTITKRPSASYGKEGSDREWLIKGKLTIHNVGGN